MTRVLRRDDMTWTLGRLFVVVAPNVSAQGLADTETDAHGNSNHEKDDEDLGDDFISATEAIHAGASTLLLGELGLLPPLFLARPDLALAFANLLGDPVGAGIGSLGGNHGFDVGVEGVAPIRAWG